MRIKAMLVLIGIAWSFVGCSKKPETLSGDYDEAQMDAAIARARSETDGFLKVLSSKGADTFSVKAPITDKNGTEHFWITDVRFEDGMFIGLIGNDPGIVANVRLGQEWKVQKDEISDWMYTRDDKIHGGYTIDPLLPTFPTAEAEALRLKLVR